MAEMRRSEVHVEFFADAVKNERRSIEEGRPIFEDKEFVRIMFPGDNKRELVAPADQPSVRNPADNSWMTYKDRYPDHYAAFQKNQVFYGEGTPIDEATFLTKARAAELKALNIHTVEALAAMPETNLPKLGMHARADMERARAYLDKAAGSAVETRLAAENAGLRDQMQILQAQVADLMAGRSAPPPPPASEQSTSTTSPFTSWSADDLKVMIKERTGQMPRGNPSLETLVRMADELNVKAEAAA